MKFSRFDRHNPAPVGYYMRPRLNSPAAVMANPALAVAELERLRAALVACKQDPGDAAAIASAALERKYT